MTKRIVTMSAYGIAWMTLCHCESVPAITFAEDDAGSEVGDPAVDGGALLTDADSSAGPIPLDAAATPVDAATTDALADALIAACPGKPPKGMSTCCNTVPCQGDCNAGDCQKCETQCAAAGLVCCTARKPLTCVPLGTACP